MRKGKPSLRDRILHLMRDGQDRKLSEIQASVGNTLTGVSAQLRALRNPENGCHDIKSTRMPNMWPHVWKYRLVSQTVEPVPSGDSAAGR
jgi:hypothetical protein